MLSVGLQIGAVHVRLQLKSAGRHPHRFGELGLKLLRHPGQGPFADGDKARALPKNVLMSREKRLRAGDGVGDGRRKLVQRLQVVLRFPFINLLLRLGKGERNQQQIEHRGAKTAGHKPHLLDPGMDIQHTIAAAAYRAIRVRRQGEHWQPGGLHFLHRRQRRGAFSALGNHQHHVGVRVDGFIMHKVVRLLDFHQQAEAVFKEVARAHRRIQ